MSNVYRISVTLTEEIVPELLQKALDWVLPKFDGFNMRLRRGVFRHYFEESGKQAPLVFSAAIFLGTLIIGDRRARMELQRRFHI